MADPPTYPAIPSTGDDANMVRASVDALKECSEIMQGLRGPRGGFNQVFIQPPNTPGQPSTPTPQGVRDGDLLVSNLTGSWTFKVWRNGQWT